MGIKLVVDSTADLSDEVLKQYGIERVSLKVHFHNQTYRDWVDIQPKEFYKQLRVAETLPTTSQPSPADFIETYKRIAEPGDTILSLHLAAKLSGTYQSAVLAKSMMPEYDIVAIDSKQATCGLGLIAVTVAKAIAKGMDKEAILTLIDKMIDSQRTLFMVDTLEYLHKGGRIGSASALVGSLLNIKPILSLDEEGGVMSIDKARGKKKAEKTMLQLLHNSYGDAPLSVVFCHADTLETMEPFIETVKQQFNIASMMIADIGSVIGTHIGPGAWGIIAHEQQLKD